MKSQHLFRRTLALIAARAAGMLPPRRLFGAVVALNRLISRFAAPAALSAREQLRFDGPSEARLYRFLDALTRYGCSFDPVIRVLGEEQFNAALADGRGVILAGPHTMLTTLVIRYLHDRELPVFLFAADESLRIPGTMHRANVARPTPQTTVRAMRMLREGGTVLSLVDRRPSVPGAGFDVAPDLFRLAAKLGSHVVFVATRLDGDHVVATLEWSTREPRSTSEVMACFTEFARQQIAATQSQFGD